MVASERLFQIDLALRVVERSPIRDVRRPHVAADRFARTVGWNRSVREVAATYDERSRTMMAAFRGAPARGSSRCRRLPSSTPSSVSHRRYPRTTLRGRRPRSSWPGVCPGTGTTSCCAPRWPRALGWEAMLELFPDLPSCRRKSSPAGATGVARRWSCSKHVADDADGQGSNNWVVDGSRTATGKPLLANDPHLTVAMPSVWFEVHLSCPELRSVRRRPAVLTRRRRSATRLITRGASRT